MRSLARIAVAGAALVVSSWAQAQTYPSRPITVVVPFAAGSGTDNVARLIMPRLEEALGQTIVMGGTSTHAASKALLKNVSYDPLKDFVPIAKFGSYPFPFFVPVSVPANTLPEFIAYAKKNPGRFSYAYANAPGRVAGESLKKHGGIDLTPVPYRASPAAITDLVAGRVEIMVVDYTTAFSQLQAGKVKALSVTSQERSALLPDVPGMKELGFPWLDLEAYTALFAPAGTPDSITRLMRKEITKALADPELIKKLATIGFEASRDDPEKFSSELQVDIDTWKRQAEEAGIEPQ
jgi:putative tricarboxylic transport membrane protein